MPICKAIGCGKEFLSRQPFDFCPTCAPHLKGLVVDVSSNPFIGCSTPSGDIPKEDRQEKRSDYRDVSNLYLLDTHRIMRLFQITDPCVQVAIRNLLHLETSETSPEVAVQEAIYALSRWQEMQLEDQINDAR